MAKTMKSYRFSDDTCADLKLIAAKLGCNETQAIEICIEWAYKSGFVYAMELTKPNTSKSTMRLLDGATESGEITSCVRAQIWGAQ